jgi:hypothetical protein
MMVKGQGRQQQELTMAMGKVKRRQEQPTTIERTTVSKGWLDRRKW